MENWATFESLWGRVGGSMENWVTFDEDEEDTTHLSNDEGSSSSPPSFLSVCSSFSSSTSSSYYRPSPAYSDLSTATPGRHIGGPDYEERPSSHGLSFASRSSSVGTPEEASMSLTARIRLNSPSPNLKWFAFSELRTATGNFSHDNCLGEVDFGNVYKGWIDENGLTANEHGKGLAVAVKRLGNDITHGHEEWLAEVCWLGWLDHPNIVKLIGCCLEDENRLLVYEFMPQGSLDKHLFSRGSQPLSWNLLMKVALEAAKGLAFLHSDEIKLIHRDVKSSVILLDSNHNAKLSEFGLAEGGPTGDETHIETAVMGTYGYADPEYIATGHLNEKSDVYGFGVVLLEMICGRRTVDRNRQSREQNLVKWAKPYLTKKCRISHVLNSRLKGQYSLGRAQKVAALALRCLSYKKKLRPSMAEVVNCLEELQGTSRTP